VSTESAEDVLQPMINANFALRDNPNVPRTLPPRDLSGAENLTNLQVGYI